MATVQIFDPAMCCSTGVCGTDVDPTLSRFAADVEWLTGQGVQVDRATLSQEPGKFVENVAVRDAMQDTGVDALPAVLVDGALKSIGAYPSREQLAAWAGVSATEQPAAEGRTSLEQADSCCGGTGCC